MTLCPGCSQAALCPRCNQWRTPSQYGAHGVCGACQCDGPDCDRPIASRRLCHGHYAQLRRGEPLTPLREVIYHRRRELITEVSHLAGSDTVEGVAARLGIKPNSIYRTLQRAGRLDLWRRLRRVAA